MLNKEITNYVTKTFKNLKNEQVLALKKEWFDFINNLEEVKGAKTKEVVKQPVEEQEQEKEVEAEKIEADIEDKTIEEQEVSLEGEK